MKLMKFMGILMSLALFATLAPVAWAAEDSVSGSFTPANVLPTVTLIEVYDDPGLTSPAASLTPQVYYFLRVTAGDGNTIEDIDQIDVEFFYDASGNDTAAPGSGDPQTCGILTWDKDGGGSEWTIDAGASTTWEILSANCTKPSDMGVASDDWVFVFMAGTVATESVGAADWDFYADAADDSGSGNLYERDREILWYGGISTSASANFGTVNNGTGFADNVNEVNGVSVTYISNGNYDQQVKSDAIWTGTTDNATYDATGNCSSAQEFSLMAFITDTFGSVVQVDTTGVSIDNTGTQTSEAGNEVATNTLWLKIALVFVNETYNGNITYIIADN